MGLGAQTCVAALVGLALACSAQPQLETRTFELKHLDGNRAEGIIAPYVYRERPGAGGMISVVGSVITVRETTDNLDRIARVLAEFDRPRPTLRLVFKIIEADGAAVRDTAIADVESALRQLFRFRGYRLVTDAVLSGVEGTEASQTLSGTGVQYLLETRIRQIRGTADSATVDLRVKLQSFGAASRGQFETDVSLPLGKTAVLGSARAGKAQSTVILTVQPELAGP